VTAGEPVVLDPDTIRVIANETARCVEALLRSERPSRRLVDAATVAATLGVSRDTVYAHAGDLGAIRVGDGPRARLRFDLNRAVAAATSSSTRKVSAQPTSPVPRRSRRPKRTTSGSSGPPLPATGPRLDLFKGEGRSR
jgi:hypothetical protein